MSAAELTPRQPTAPIDDTRDLSCPLLGLFGEEDKGPTPEQVARHEQELQKHGKTYEFHMYAGAGHGFFYYDRPAYRQQQAVDGWTKVFAFWRSISPGREARDVHDDRPSDRGRGQREGVSGMV
jgi:carboxymethylenebutenolidase